MAEHFQRELKKLKQQIFALGGLVEEHFRKGTLALIEGDAILAQTVIDEDLFVDDKEVEIEEACLKILALHQPVAGDLRYIVAVLKINSDLERIGDLAASISFRAKLFQAEQEPGFVLPVSLHKMAEVTQRMLQRSLDALINYDSDLARIVLADDDLVDLFNREIFDYVRERLVAGSQHAPQLIHLLTVARAIERAADHITNIAEDIIYMLEGEIVRHKKEQQTPDSTSPPPN
jgi:phosphate transport system protein